MIAYRPVRKMETTSVEASTVIQNYFTREDIYNALQSMPDTLDVEPGDIEQLLAIIDKNKCDLK